MRRSRVMGPAVLALVVVLGGCAAEGNGAAETASEAGAIDEQQMGEQIASPLNCQPSERMAVAGRPSPYDSTTIQLGDSRAKICYGRPSLRGRTMIGGEAVPYDTLWRTGANEPTIIHLGTAAEIAGIRVEPGSYSLYTVPREEGPWTLIVNSATEQWGHESQYTAAVRSQEVGRADVQAERIEQRVEQLTIRPMDGEETGVLLEWQNSRVRVPITPVG